MTELELEEFGRAYVRQLREKVHCYELAAAIFDGDIDFLNTVKEHHAYVETMQPIDVAVIILDSWGATIPDEILRKSNCIRTNFAGTLTIN